MEEGFEKNGVDREEIFSKAVRAGKRTYFFDVKSTRGNDYYLTITESKKRFGDDGKFFYEKHKLFLYKEDFEKFTEGFAEVIEHIKSISPIEVTSSETSTPEEVSTTETQKTDNSFSDVNFEDLDK
ncbi:MAG: PUR family DNA/RNA-binding protein [Bacteroidetes bacterium]|nr:PUR family DNA/RNA-binding protein [Bacteroidota bacterium]